MSITQREDFSSLSYQSLLIRGCPLSEGVSAEDIVSTTANYNISPTHIYITYIMHRHIHCAGKTQNFYCRSMLIAVAMFTENKSTNVLLSRYALSNALEL